MKHIKTDDKKPEEIKPSPEITDIEKPAESELSKDTKDSNTGNSSPEIILEYKDLPSQGLSYPKDGKIKYRPYVFGEIKKFNSTDYVGRRLYEFILTGIETKGFDKGQLTLSDFLYMGLLRKIATIKTKNVGVTFYCNNPKCAKPKNTFVLPINELHFTELKMPTLPIVATLDSGEYHFMPITVEQFLVMSENPINDLVPVYDDAIELLAKEVCNKEEDLTTYLELFNIFYNCSNDDGFILDQVDDMLYHGATPIEKKCGECGTQKNVELEGVEILISPFRSDEEPVKHGIRFGV